MNRRDVLKTVGSTVLLPTISVPSASSTTSEFHLAEIFGRYNYGVYDTPAGQCFAAEIIGSNFSIQYRVFPFEDKTEFKFAQDFENNIAIRREYQPQNHVEAFTLFRICENQGLDELRSALECMEIKQEQVIKNHQIVYEQ